MTKQFKGFTMPEGIYFPPELRQLLPDLTTRSEIVVLLVILDAYFQAGLDATPLTFDDIAERTGLESRTSVNGGVKRLLARGLIHRLAVGDTYAYEPTLKEGSTESVLPCHDSYHDHGTSFSSHEDDMTWKSKICTVLVQKFGVASRVAQDIAYKRDPAYVQKHIDYALYEINAGFQPNRLAGFIVARIRDDKPPPLGYTGDWQNKTQSEKKRWFTDEEYDKFFLKPGEMPE